MINVGGKGTSGWRLSWVPGPNNGHYYDYLIKRDGVFDQWGNEVTKQITFSESMVKGDVVRTFPTGSLTGIVILDREGEQSSITVMDGDSLEITWKTVVVGAVGHFDQWVHWQWS